LWKTDKPDIYLLRNALPAMFKRIVRLRHHFAAAIHRRPADTLASFTLIPKLPPNSYGQRSIDSITARQYAHNT
jgi:hypothetical protein